jgi:hypothetical protein
MLAPEDDETETDGVTISSASGVEIYNALYEIPRQTNSVLIWSFGGCLIADPSVMNDFPQGLIDDLGEPTIVHGGLEIAEAVERT